MPLSLILTELFKSKVSPSTTLVTKKGPSNTAFPVKEQPVMKINMNKRKYFIKLATYLYS